MTQNFNNTNTLVLFTYNFPFGRSETFLELEIVFLSNTFKKVIIISSDTESNSVRKVPDNVIFIRKSFVLSKFDKLKSLKYIFNSLIIKEIINLIRLKSFNKLNLNYLLRSLPPILKIIRVMKVFLMLTIFFLSIELVKMIQ